MTKINYLVKIQKSFRKSPVQFRAFFYMVVAAMLAMLSASIGQAQTLTWDPLLTTTGSDGSGTWNTGTTADWASGGADVVWAASDSAVIGKGTGAAGTVNLPAAVTVANLTNNAAGSGNYVFTGSALTITAGDAVAVNSSVTYSNQLNNSGGVNGTAITTTLGNNAVLTLANIGTYLAGTISGGNASSAVSVTGGSMTGSGLGNVTVNAGSASSKTGGFQISGTASLLFQGGLQVGIASAGGYMQVGTGGTVSSSASGFQLTVGRNGSDQGYLLVNGGTVNANASSASQSIVMIGRSSGQGTLEVQSGAVTVTNSSGIATAGGGILTLNADSTSGSSTGTLKIDGGTVKVEDLRFNGGNNTGTASAGSATLTMTSGSLYIGGLVETLVAAGTVSGGITNLGTGTSAYSITLSGGTLGAMTNWSSVLNMDLGSSGGPLTIQAASANNVSNNITLSGVLSDSQGFIKTGTGKLTLSGTNTYSGSTAVNAGTLALTGAGSISNSSSITIAAGATLDVSGLTATTFNLSSSTSLGASGTGNTAGTAAAIKGAAGGTVNLGSQAITLTYDGSDPALYVSQGTLSLNGNAITVNKPAPLGPGSYTIIQQNGGTITTNGTCTVSGTAIPAGAYVESISLTNGTNLVLTITSTSTATTTTLGSLSAINYGQSVTFAATVSPTPDGGTVQFYDNGVALGSAAAVNPGTGVASLAVNNLSAGNHPISAVFSGTSDYAISTSGTSTQTVNQLAVTVASGLSIQNQPWNGTTTATILSNNVVLSGVLSGDAANVSLSTNAYTANFTSSNIGTAIPVTVGGLSLTGTASDNYSLTQPSLTGNIVMPMPATLTWDGNAATPNPDDASGSWSGTGNWWIGGLNTNWIDGSFAVFGAGTPGSYTVDLGGGSFYPTNLTFNISGYTLTNGAVTVTAATGNPITVSNNVAATISCAYTSTVSGLVYYVANGGTLTFAGGGSLVSGNAEFAAAAGANVNGTGTVDFKSGTYAGNFTLWLQINATQEAGTLNLSRLLIGYGANSTFTINNPSAQLVGNGGGGNNLLGRSGTSGALDLKQGTVTMTASGNEMRIGYDNTANSQGTLTVEGGTFNLGSTINNLYVNYGGTASSDAGTFNLSGGTVTARSILLGGGGSYSSGSTAALNVTGGALYAGAGGVAINPTNTGTLAASIVLSGGTIGAATNWVSSSPMTLTNINGNITFQTADTNNNPQNITLSGVLSGPLGGVIKTGSGTLTLNNAETYAGNTVISGGTLALSGSGSISDSPNIVIGDGAVFNVSGLSFTFALGGSQTLSNSISTAVLNGNAGTGSGTVALTYAAGTPALNVTNGTLTLASGTTFNVNNIGSALASGNYEIISTNADVAGAAAAVAGTLPSVTVGGAGTVSGSTNVLQLVNNELYLVVDHPVAGATFTLPVTLGVAATIQIVGGKYAPTDGDGAALVITSVSGAVNGTVTTDGTNVTYTATNGTTDSFSYTVSDGYGGTAVGTVNVVINSSVAAQQGQNQLSVPQMINGNVVLSYLGIPGYTYALDWTHSLSTPITWLPLLTNAAAGNGALNFTNTPSGGSDYYRTRYVP